MDNIPCKTFGSPFASYKYMASTGSSLSEPSGARSVAVFTSGVFVMASSRFCSSAVRLASLIDSLP